MGKRTGVSSAPKRPRTCFHEAPDQHPTRSQEGPKKPKRSDQFPIPNRRLTVPGPEASLQSPNIAKYL